MRPLPVHLRIVFGLTAAMLAAGASVGQPIPTHGPAPTPHPQKCPYHYRLALVRACSAKKPWKCEPCPHGVRILPRVDKCGAPEEVCAPS